MSVTRVLLGFAALTNALAAWAWVAAGKPELAAFHGLSASGFAVAAYRWREE